MPHTGGSTNVRENFPFFPHTKFCQHRNRFFWGIPDGIVMLGTLNPETIGSGLAIAAPNTVLLVFSGIGDFLSGFALLLE